MPRTWKSKKLVHAKPSQYSSRIRFLTNLRSRCQLFNSKTAFTYRESCLGMISHGSLSNKNLNHRTNAFTRKIGPNHASRKKIGDLQVTFFSVSVQISRNTYMLFTGWEVRIGRNCARGLEYPDRGHSFSQYGPT